MGKMILTGLCGLWLSGCSEPAVSPPKTLLRVWSHQGQEAENETMRDMVTAFNLAHADEGLAVYVDFFPDYQYTEKLSIAAAGGDLPDVFDLDGPTVAQFADAGLLQPLPPLLPDLNLDDFQPAIRDQGTYKGELLALGAYDSALVLYADRKMFAEANIPLPQPHTAWEWSEFVAVLQQFKARDIQPISLHMQISADEWFTYAFSPLLWSAGGRLISADGSQVEGILNSPTNIDALRKWQALFTEGLAQRSPVNPDPFGSGETPLDWNGHWMAQSHWENKGDDLVVLPLPRIGVRPAAASGSWCWAVSAHSPHPEAAAKWLAWVLDTETGIAPMLAANGALPARASAYQVLPQFDHPPFATFRYLQENAARARPRTPIYPNLTRSFAAALRDIARGEAVDETLDRATADLQRLLDRKGEIN